MREEALKSFLEAVKTDAGLQEKLKAAADDDSIVAIAKEAGYVIAAEELKKQADTEISDKELESAAGGNAARCDIPIPCIVRASQYAETMQT